VRTDVVADTPGGAIRFGSSVIGKVLFVLICVLTAGIAAIVYAEIARSLLNDDTVKKYAALYCDAAARNASAGVGQATTCNLAAANSDSAAAVPVRPPDMAPVGVEVAARIVPPNQAKSAVQSSNLSAPTPAKPAVQQSFAPFPPQSHSASPEIFAAKATDTATITPQFAASANAAADPGAARSRAPNFASSANLSASTPAKPAVPPQLSSIPAVVANAPVQIPASSAVPSSPSRPAPFQDAGRTIGAAAAAARAGLVDSDLVAKGASAIPQPGDLAAANSDSVPVGPVKPPDVSLAGVEVAARIVPPDQAKSAVLPANPSAPAPAKPAVPQSFAPSSPQSRPASRKIFAANAPAAAIIQPQSAASANAAANPGAARFTAPNSASSAIFFVSKPARHAGPLSSAAGKVGVPDPRPVTYLPLRDEDLDAYVELLLKPGRGMDGFEILEDLKVPSIHGVFEQLGAGSLQYAPTTTAMGGHVPPVCESEEEAALLSLAKYDGEIVRLRNVIIWHEREFELLSSKRELTERISKFGNAMAALTAAAKELAQLRKDEMELHTKFRKDNPFASPNAMPTGSGNLYKKILAAIRMKRALGLLIGHPRKCAEAKRDLDALVADRQKHIEAFERTRGDTGYVRFPNCHRAEEWLRLEGRTRELVLEKNMAVPAAAVTADSGRAAIAEAANSILISIAGLSRKEVEKSATELISAGNRGTFNGRMEQFCGGVRGGCDLSRMQSLVERFENESWKTFREFRLPICDGADPNGDPMDAYALDYKTADGTSVSMTAADVFSHCVGDGEGVNWVHVYRHTVALLRYIANCADDRYAERGPLLYGLLCLWFNVDGAREMILGKGGDVDLQADRNVLMSTHALPPATENYWPWVSRRVAEGVNIGEAIDAGRFGDDCVGAYRKNSSLKALDVHSLWPGGRREAFLSQVFFLSAFGDGRQSPFRSAEEEEFCQRSLGEHEKMLQGDPVAYLKWITRAISARDDEKAGTVGLRPQLAFGGPVGECERDDGGDITCCGEKCRHIPADQKDVDSLIAACVRRDEIERRCRESERFSVLWRLEAHLGEAAARGDFPAHLVPHVSPHSGVHIDKTQPGKVCFWIETSDGAYDVKLADEESLEKLNNDICACSYFDGGQRDGKLCGLLNDLRCTFR
jgi:hypothetical protein